MAQARDKSRCAPVAQRGAPCETMSLWAAAVAAHHVGLGPGFVEEDDAFGVETMLFSAPLLPRGRHIRSLLLVGENRFFIDHLVPVIKSPQAIHAGPAVALISQTSRISSSVRSGSCATSDNNQAS